MYIFYVLSVKISKIKKKFMNTLDLKGKKNGFLSH